MDTVDEVEIKYKCTVCTSELDDVIKTRYDVMVCNDCVVICRRCDDILSTNDEFNDVEGDTWCQSCTSDSAHWCDMCENYFTGYTYGADDTSDCMCERCYENNTTYCEDCDATYVNGCEYNHDDEADGRVIHDYSYRPDPIFHSSEDEQTRLYFGIEVETEAIQSGAPLAKTGDVKGMPASEVRSAFITPTARRIWRSSQDGTVRSVDCPSVKSCRLWRRIANGIICLPSAPNSALVLCQDSTPDIHRPHAKPAHACLAYSLRQPAAPRPVADTPATASESAARMSRPHATTRPHQRKEPVNV